MSRKDVLERQWKIPRTGGWQNVQEKTGCDVTKDGFRQDFPDKPIHLASYDIICAD